ncbi:MAG: CAP domain-containing protein [Desulfosporosinus sp.]|jgi:uncharacterized YkwD family protein
MKRKSRLLIGLPFAILMAAAALPVQAAYNTGASSTGSGVTKQSCVPVTVPVTTKTKTTKTTVQWVTLGQLPSNLRGNVVSWKYIFYKPIKPITPAPAPTPTPTPTPAPSPSPKVPAIPLVTALTADEQLMVNMINQERSAAGLNPLKVDLRLASVARAKANDMKVNNYFSHTSPTYGSPWDMMQQVGISYRRSGENISGNKSVAASMASLMQSPGHRANILNPSFTHVGVGIAYGSAYGTLYVQEFIQQ